MALPSPYAPSPSPTSTLDYTTVSLIAIGSFLMLLGNITIFVNRRFPPIKTKSVPITLLSSAGGLIFILSTLIVNEHFKRRKNSILSLCSLWTYWLDACFGFALWLNCLTLHLIRLYRIFVCKRSVHKHGYALLFPLLLPAVAFCIVGSVRKEIR